MTLKLHPAMIVLFLLANIVLFLLSGCAFVGLESDQTIHRLTIDQHPVLMDDFDIDSFNLCIRRQISFLKKQTPNKTVSFGQDTYNYAWLLHSAEELLIHLKDAPDNNKLRRFLTENYVVYQAGGRKEQAGRQMLVTGYYEPVFAGNIAKAPPYIYPIYSTPDSLVNVAGQNDKPQLGRYDHNGVFVAYWSRAEIENTDKLASYEMVYLKNPFDAFLLHIQGSGRILLPDQTIRTIHYAASNGLEYKSIGKLLVDERKMMLEEVSIPAIRIYLEKHPDDLQRILHHNPRFIFFKWGDTLGPRGSSGEVLTPGRSIAIDPAVLPEGSIGFLISQIPYPSADENLLEYKPMSRFVFPQDSGAAIQGSGRVDVFLGHDDFAEFAAQHMREKGELYFLVKKGYAPNGGI